MKVSVAAVRLSGPAEVVSAGSALCANESSCRATQIDGPDTRLSVRFTGRCDPAPRPLRLHTSYRFHPHGCRNR
jgi:hypothetical protein